jgi:hypothetical protein
LNNRAIDAVKLSIAVYFLLFYCSKTNLTRPYGFKLKGSDPFEQGLAHLIMACAQLVNKW